MLLANDGALGGKQMVPKDYLSRRRLAPPAGRVHAGQGDAVFRLRLPVLAVPGEKRRFALLGVYGQSIFVDPELKLVMVITGDQRTPASARRALPASAVRCGGPWWNTGTGRWRISANVWALYARAQRGFRGLRHRGANLPMTFERRPVRHSIEKREEYRMRQHYDEAIAARLLFHVLGNAVEGLGPFCAHVRLSLRSPCIDVVQFLKRELKLLTKVGECAAAHTVQFVHCEFASFVVRIGHVIPLFVRARPFPPLEGYT